MSKSQRQVDWEAVWNSLNWDDAKRQQALDRERLRQRAKHYAAPVQEKEAIPEDAKSMLLFDLGAESYAIDVMAVRGLRPLGKVTRVPGAPPFYRGVTNVRGQIISVLDLRAFLSLREEQEVIVPDEIVLARGNGLEVALLAHQINGVSQIAASAVKAVEHMPYALGITRERVILLDIEQLLKDERLIAGGGNE